MGAVRWNALPRRRSARNEGLEEAAKYIEGHYWDSLQSNELLHLHVRALASQLRALKDKAA